jgi:hypothetical protein
MFWESCQELGKRSFDNHVRSFEAAVSVRWICDPINQLDPTEIVDDLRLAIVQLASVRSRLPKSRAKSRFLVVKAKYVQSLFA